MLFFGTTTIMSYFIFRSIRVLFQLKWYYQSKGCFYTLILHNLCINIFFIPSGTDAIKPARVEVPRGCRKGRTWYLRYLRVSLKFQTKSVVLNKVRKTRKYFLKKDIFIFHLKIFFKFVIEIHTIPYNYVVNQIW